MSENWDAYLQQTEDGPVGFFVDLAAEGPQASRPVVCRVSVRLLNPSEHGFASRHEDEVLFQLEDRLEAKLAEQCRAQYVGRATSGGVRVFFYYMPKSVKPESAIRECFRAFPNYREAVNSEPDPSWAHYLEFLFPDPASMQCIVNRRVLQKLTDNGDPLTQPRRVDHWLYFPDRESAERFLAQPALAGFQTEGLMESDDEWKLQIYRTDLVDQDSIDDLTIELCDLAEDEGGRYDGWETELLTEA